MFALWMRLDPVSLLQQNEHSHLCLPLPAAASTAFPSHDPRTQCEHHAAVCASENREVEVPQSYKMKQEWLSRE